MESNLRMGSKKINTAEFYKLRTLLEHYNIPFVEAEHDEALQLIYPNWEERKSDVVISAFSYGADEGLLEQMGLLEKKSKNVVKGYLTAEDVFNCWAEDYGFFVKGLDIKEAFNMSTAKLQDGWIKCGKCGHKLGRVTESGTCGTSSKIEIKCHSCKELNLFSFLNSSPVFKG